MKKDYRNETELDIMYLASATRMLQLLGEGELEIKNQGRFLYFQSFSQETGAIGRQTPRNGEGRLKLERELSAGCTLGSDFTPHFFSSEISETKMTNSSIVGKPYHGD